MFLTATETVFSLRQGREKRASAVWRLQLAGADPSAQVEGHESLPGKVNYMIGNDKSQWHTGIPTFRKVQYRHVWPGVDMVWYGTQNPTGMANRRCPSSISTSRK